MAAAITLARSATLRRDLAARSWVIPMKAGTNPIGSIADHAAMHVSAVAHSYETEVRLPPATEAP